MKKAFTILMAAVMLFVLSASAFAAATTENVLNWTDVEADVEKAGMDAGFVQIGDMNLKMWLPSVFKEEELTEEDIENGYIAYLVTKDNAEIISIMSVDIGASLEAWEKELPDYGVTDAEMGIINGFKALIYSVPEDDTMCVDFEADSGEILEFTFYPMSDEEFASVASLITMSLQSIE